MSPDVYYLPVIVILEGPDLVGKTTVARHLRKRAEAPDSPFREVRLSRRGPIPPGSGLIEEYVRPMIDGVPSDVLWIADRWHLGEHVYGTTIRQDSHYARPHALSFEDVDNLISWGAQPLLKYVLTATDDFLTSRYRMRAESLPLNQVLNVALEYRRAVRHITHAGLSGWVQIEMDDATSYGTADMIWSAVLAQWDQA